MAQIHVLDGQMDSIVAVLANSDKTVFWDDVHFMQLANNKETFDFTTIPEGPASAFLRKRNRLIIPTEDGQFREFIIDEAIQDFETVQVFSTASHLELQKGKPLQPAVHQGQSLNSMMDIILAGTGWTRGKTDYSGTATVEFETYRSPFDALQETATAHEMELVFRVETDGNAITGRYVDAVKRVGTWSGRELDSSKDLINATRHERTDEVVTALVGLGPEREDGSRITVEVTDEDARQVWGREGRHLWGIYEVQSDNQDLTLAQIQSYTERALAARIAAVVEYTIEGADLEYILGLENEKIRLGDSVRIKATEYEPPLYLDARVIAIETSVSDRTQKQYTLGEFIEYTEDDITALRDYFQAELAKKANIYYGDTPPANTNWLWVDTSGTTNVAKTYNPTTGTWEAESMQGPPGQDGQDGTSLYTWIKYADDALGNGISDSPTGKKYIGIAYNMPESIESNNPAVYEWALFEGPQGPQGLQGMQGPQGDQGIQGPAGADGVSSYTHIAYADSADGTLNFSTTDSNNKTYIGIYVDNTPADSTNPASYQWTLIKGADGAQGLPGPAGADGQTPYFHTAWADSADGTVNFSTTNAGTRTYLGTYTDYTAADSTNPASYTWSKIQGPQGVQGPQGPQGQQGIQGPAGADGQSLYTWVKYADDATGTGMSDSPTGKEYIGLAYNKTTPIESNTASDYTWSLIKGDQGVQGPAGANGQSLYTWIKYADSPTTGMSDDPTGKAYMGIAYNKTVATESTNYTDYAWSLIEGPKGDTGATGPQGAQGPQGIQGPAGADGQSLYTWIKYADTSTGTGMSDLPDGKEYIGIAYNKTTPTESSNAADYTWSLIQGPQGIQGPTGANGQSLYTWIKYADSPTTGMSDSPTGKTYMGIAYNKTTATESTNYADYSWSLIQGPQGSQGPQGPAGTTYYTWIKYADDAIGTGLSDSPTGKKYMGVASNKTSATESTNAADYQWSLIQGPQGPNVVDSTTTIEANVIKANHIDVLELSAITADLGTVNAGTLNAVDITGASITGTTISGSIFQSSDANSSMELSDGYGIITDYGASSWTIWNAYGIQVGTGDPGTPSAVKAVYAGIEGGSGYINSDNTGILVRADWLMDQGSRVLGYQQTLRLATTNMYGSIYSYIDIGYTSGITLEPYSGVISANGDLEVSGSALRLLAGTAMSIADVGGFGNSLYLNSSGDWVRNYSESGFCGIGGQAANTTTGAIVGTGVNYRTLKNYTPSSVSLSTSSNTAGVNGLVTDINGHGFWLYLNGGGTTGQYRYWRGTFTA